jgi:hypothetical protein
MPPAVIPFYPENPLLIPEVRLGEKIYIRHNIYS